MKNKLLFSLLGLLAVGLAWAAQPASAQLVHNKFASTGEVGVTKTFSDVIDTSTTLGYPHANMGSYGVVAKIYVSTGTSEAVFTTSDDTLTSATNPTGIRFSKADPAYFIIGRYTAVRATGTDTTVTIELVR